MSKELKMKKIEEEERQLEMRKEKQEKIRRNDND
jgi:hypothetical protein